MAWVKQDDYYATQGEWKMTRSLVCGEEMFSLWLIGTSDSTSGKPERTRAIPVLFKSAVDASAWAKWAETNARDRIEAKAVTKPLTENQMELI